MISSRAPEHRASSGRCRPLGLVGPLASERTGGAGLSEIATISGRPKASVHRMLQALIAMGYVERLEEGGYRLGVQSQILGQLAQKSVDPLVIESESSLPRLAEITQDTAFLTLRTGVCDLRTARGGLRRHLQQCPRRRRPASARDRRGQSRDHG